MSRRSNEATDIALVLDRDMRTVAARRGRESAHTEGMRSDEPTEVR